MRALLAVLSCTTITFLSAPVRAADMPYAGVWTGTIGAADIMVCFDPHGSSYYPVKRLAGIPLFENGDREFSEFARMTAGKTAAEGSPDAPGDAGAAPTGLWRMERMYRGTPQWKWVDPKTSRTLPIKLRLLRAARPGKPGCHEPRVGREANPLFMLYHSKRVQAAKRSVSPAAFAGQPYKAVKAIGGVGFQLPASYPQAAMLNAFADRWLKAQTANAYDCAMHRAERAQGKHQALAYRKTLRPDFRLEDWLVLDEHLPATPCGGAHDINSHASYIVDLTTGKFVDHSAWLKHRKDKSGSARLSTGLTALIRKTAEADPNHSGCAQTYAITPRIAKQGLAFHPNPPGASRRCDGEVVIPYAALKPFLTAEGAAAMAVLGRKR